MSVWHASKHDLPDSRAYENPKVLFARLMVVKEIIEGSSGAASSSDNRTNGLRKAGKANSLRLKISRKIRRVDE